MTGLLAGLLARFQTRFQSRLLTGLPARRWIRLSTHRFAALGLAGAILAVPAAWAGQRPSATRQAGPQPSWQARILPGCLAPHPEALAGAGLAAGRVRMATDVNELGQGHAWQLLESSGSAAADAMLMASLKACRFALPAGKPPGMPARHVMSHSWDARQVTLGPGRCFPLDYPKAALTEGATGTIRLGLQRLEDGAEVSIEATWVQGQHPALMQASLDAARGCLRHDGVSQAIPVGPWHSVVMDWSL